MRSTIKGMILCNECGHPIRQGSRLCPDCGAGIPLSSKTVAARRATAPPVVTKTKAPVSMPERAAPAGVSPPTTTSAPPTRTSPYRDKAGKLRSSDLAGQAAASPASGNFKAGLVATFIGIFLLIASIGIVLLFLKLRRDKATVTEVTQSNSANNSNVKKKEAPPAAPPGMSYVKGGAFFMGSNTGDELERPSHKVQVQPFFIDVYEVTCEAYQKFIQATQHRAPTGWTNNQYPPGSAKLPVTGVDWDDASAYAKWAGKRLPTEEEWEFAARGTQGLRYPWGNEWIAQAANAEQATSGRLSEVGKYSAGCSPSGAYDMIGNAWEWTASDVRAYPGGRIPKQQPVELKIIRGGCYLSDRNQEATTTYRGVWPARGNYDYTTSGFRCAKDVTTLSR